MGRGTPDRTVDEAFGTPDVQIAEGDILTSDEHAALNHAGLPGVDSAASGAVGPALLYPLRSGDTLRRGRIGTTTKAGAVGEGYLHFVPLQTDVQVDELGLRVTTGGAAGAVWRLGAYQPDADLDPNGGTLIVDGGVANAESTGIISVTFAPVTFAAPGVWLIAVCQVAASTARRYDLSADVAAALSTASTLTNAMSNSVNNAAFRTGSGQILGALPDPGFTGWLEEATAAIGMGAVIA